MSINWYPGHMVTARTKAAETMRKTDLVIEVLDARAPHASCNPVFERLRLAGQRPALKLLNKSDVADPEQTRRWLQHYNSQPGVQAIALCAKRSGELERVLRACRALRPHRGAADKPLRMMILGIPNVGKSTLMNAFLKRHVAHVGDEPAITKVQMFHRLGPGMSLVDTPGMLWPGMAQDTAARLAALHSIGRGAYDDEEVALTLGRYLLSQYPELLARRFGVLPRPCDEHTLLALIAAGRSLVTKSRGPDIARASLALLNDFRTGTLGRITLETVEGGPKAPEMEGRRA
jgi:ribosome biogenesis GTPase A